MSRRYQLLHRLVHSIGPQISRSDVGTAKEVKEYHQARQRALQWVTNFKLRPWRRTPTDAVAIEYALCHHLFDPLSRLPPDASQPCLKAKDSLIALKTCQEMLRDLESHFTAKNVIRCAERMAHILAYSKRDIWCRHHESCLVHLSQMIQLTLPRCTRPDLGTLIWSFGKWGPRALDVKLDADTTIRQLVDRILERICEVGLKGELYNDTISNLLNGCVRLQIHPDEKLLKNIFQELLGSLEFIDGHVMSRLLSSLAQMRLKVPLKLKKRVAEVLETKIKAGNYPEQEIPFMLRCLGEWQSAYDVPEFMDMCRAVERHRLEWTSMEWTLQHDALMLEGFLHLRFFPSWQLLETIHASVKNNAVVPSVKLDAAVLSVFGEMGVRSECLLQRCLTALEKTEEDDRDASSMASLVKGLALVGELKIEHYLSALHVMRRHATELKSEDKEALYFAFLQLSHVSDDAEKELLRVDRLLLESFQE